MRRFWAMGIVVLGLAFAPITFSYGAEEVEYDYGDHTSVTLAVKGWEALAQKDYNAVAAYTKKCIELYAQKAAEQQASLTDFAPKENAFDYWALNDVATCYFILGKSYKEQNLKEEAREAFKKIVSDYGFAQCWDEGTKSHWKVAEGAKDQLNLLESAYDYGDYTSQTLTTKAWDSLGKKDYQGVDVYTKKCLQLYEEEAQKMQKELTDYASKDKAFNYWALNDVGTCYFILGESLAEQKKFQEALEAYKVVMEEFSYAQCWDPKGWFWKPAVAARGKINKIKAEQGL